MRDHFDDSTRSPTIPELVGVRELKAHAARILRRVRDARASYVLTHRGRAIGVILPLDAAESQSAALDTSDTAAWTNFIRAGRRLQSRFHKGASGVRLLSSMRR